MNIEVFTKDEIPDEVLKEIRNEYSIDWDLYGQSDVPKNATSKRLNYERNEEKRMAKLLDPETLEPVEKLCYVSEGFIARGVWDEETNHVFLWEVKSLGFVNRPV